MILHCSCLLPHRHAPTLSSGFPFLPSNFQLLGSSVSLPSNNLKKLILSVQDVPHGLVKDLNMLQRLVLSKCEGTRNDHLVADKQKLAMNKGMISINLPAAVLLCSNVFMLAAPLEALAETCEADSLSFSMPLLLLVALVGAAVGGLVARQRKGELQKVNEQLRQINAALRRQAKIESYAPALSYAPTGSRILESEVVIDPRRQELLTRLKSGKNHLRNQDPGKALVEFEAGFELAQQLNDLMEQKKAARGLGASLQRQGKYRDAIKYHSMVLDISNKQGEDSGNTEAYGAIADCYTELGELEKAGKYYDMYIARLETD